MERAIFELRAFRPNDGAAYAALLARSPDTGTIGTAETFEIDPYQMLVGIHPEAYGLVADAPDHRGLAGGACVRFGHCQWEGKVVPSALLHTVVVDPAFRRQGLASELETRAAREVDKDGLFYAIIQRNNTGSERASGRWANHFLRSRLAFVSMPTRSKRPSGAHGLRPMQAQDVASVVEGMNGFYRDHNLYPPETPDSLAGWLSSTPFATPYRHYRVAEDKDGALLGGLAVTETYRLRTTQITRMPSALRLLNRVFHVVPVSGQLREVTVSRAWFARGEAGALRRLLEAVRWEWRERGTTIMVYADVRSPVLRACPWMSRAAAVLASFAIRAPRPCSQDRLLYYA